MGASGKQGVSSSDDAGARRAAAVQLHSTARAHASAAAEDLLDRRPGAGERVGRAAFEVWQAFLTQRVHELATAVEFGEPGLFGAQIEWLRSTLDARSIEPGDVDEAIECLRDSVNEGLPPVSARLSVEVLAAASREAAWCPPSPARLDDSEAHGALALAFLERALSGDVPGAVDGVLSARAGGETAADLMERVLMPAQAEVGLMWQLGEIGVYEEHAATEAVRTALAVVWQACRDGARPEGSPVVVGSVAGDQHDIGARVTTLLLQLGGRAAACLGADVPGEEFGRAARDLGSGSVVVSATMSHHLSAARDAVASVREVAPGVRVILGGPAFTLVDGLAGRLVTKLGADGFAARPRDAADAVGAG